MMMNYYLEYVEGSKFSGET